MTLTPEEEDEVGALLTSLDQEEREGLPTTEELEREAAAKTEAQKTLDGADADTGKLKNGKKQKTAEDLEREHRTLKVLGYEEYDDRDDEKHPALNFKIHLPPAVWSELVKKTYEARSAESDTGYDGITVVRQYSPQFTNGRFSASPYVVENKKRIYPKNESGKSEYLTHEEYCSLRPVKQFYHYRDEVPDQPLPPAIVTGKLVDVRGGGSCIQIDGHGEDQVIMYPTSLIHKDKDKVHSIPASLSIADKAGNLRMNIPRLLILPDYEKELKAIKERKASEPAKKKEEQPDYDPEHDVDMRPQKGDSEEKEVTTTKDSDTEEDAYTQQAKKQVHSIRETFEICYDEAADFVEKKIEPHLRKKLADEAEYAEKILKDWSGDKASTAPIFQLSPSEDRELEIQRLLEDVRVRIAQGFSITHQQNQRSRRY